MQICVDAPVVLDLAFLMPFLIYLSFAIAKNERKNKLIIGRCSFDSGKCECALFGDYVDDLNKMLYLPIV